MILLQQDATASPRFVWGDTLQRELYQNAGARRYHAYIHDAVWG